MRSTFKSVSSKQSRLPNIMSVGLIQSAEDFKRKDWPLRKKEFCIINYSWVPGLPFRIASPHNHVCTFSYSVVSRLSLRQSLWDSMDCNPPGSSVPGIVQARILEWVATSSSRGSSQPRDQTHVSWTSCIGRQILYHCTTWEVHIIWHIYSILS